MAFLDERQILIYEEAYRYNKIIIKYRRGVLYD